MKDQIKEYTDTIIFDKWLPGVLSFIGSLLFLAQLWSYAHTRESNLDEGAYLYKGYLFATGKYSIYQPYGFWSNHMPLSFLVPGYVQRLFGPGLATGRYFSVLLALTMLIAVWLTTRRLAGNWWAAAAVGFIVINPAATKMYSLAVSQVMVAATIAWILFFVLGEDRKLIQLILGSILSGLLVMMRINMLPFVPLLILYIFWEHGKRAGWLTLISSVGTILICHLFFLPGILQMWAYWLPRKITPFLNNWRLPEGYQRFWDPEYQTISKTRSFFQAVIVHFIAIIGFFGSLLLWSSKKRCNFKSIVLLTSLFLILLIEHVWATLTMNYCAFCLSSYVAFFAPIGIILITLTAPNWLKTLKLWQVISIIVFILIFTSGIGLAKYPEYIDFSKYLLEKNVPILSIHNFDIQGETLNLGYYLQERLGLDLKEIFIIPPLLFGFLSGILIILVAILIKLALFIYHKLKHIIPSKPGASVGAIAFIILFIIGTLLTPTNILAGDESIYDCTYNTIETYEKAGNNLAEVIPAGSNIYWKGGLSVVPLLYIQNVAIHPPQVNDVYSFYSNGDANTLLKFGFWNQDLADHWLKTSDYVLVEDKYYKQYLKKVLKSGAYEEIGVTQPTVNCRDDSAIRIFKRKQ